MKQERLRLREIILQQHADVVTAVVGITSSGGGIVMEKPSPVRREGWCWRRWGPEEHILDLPTTVRLRRMPA